MKIVGPIKFLGANLIPLCLRGRQAQKARVSVEPAIAEGAACTQPQGIRFKRWQSDWDPSVRPHVVKKVLIVNDEPHKVKDQGDFFVSHSPAAEVVYMGGGERDFLETALKAAFDLILMDGDLTVAQGVLLIRELRQKGFQGFIAAGSSSEKENRAMRDNGADFTLGRGVDRLAEYF
ncbi:MAG: response regulator [Candidatus Saganbacteria bacterium]|nr:response regulator [Candidatus Saganbacteria bacterium]